MKETFNEMQMAVEEFPVATDSVNQQVSFLILQLHSEQYFRPKNKYF